MQALIFVFNVSASMALEMPIFGGTSLCRWDRGGRGWNSRSPYGWQCHCTSSSSWNFPQVCSPCWFCHEVNQVFPHLSFFNAILFAENNIFVIVVYTCTGCPKSLEPMENPIVIFLFSVNWEFFWGVLKPSVYDVNEDHGHRIWHVKTQNMSNSKFETFVRPLTRTMNCSAVCKETGKKCEVQGT